MSAAKLPQPPPSAAACTLRSSVLTLSILTLFSFSYLSFKSLHSPSLQSSLSTNPTPGTVQPSRPQENYNANVNIGDEIVFKSKKDIGESGDADDDVYYFPKVFGLNYEEMERRFKLYIYSDGDPNTYYQTPRKLTGKYASEGYFFQNLRERSFVTDDPDRAYLFFIPISCHKMRGKDDTLFLGRA